MPSSNSQTHLTKAGYILLNSNSLSRVLSNNNWPEDIPIKVVSGKHNTKHPSSALKKALDQSKLKRYSIGDETKTKKGSTFLFAVA